MIEQTFSLSPTFSSLITSQNVSKKKKKTRSKIEQQSSGSKKSVQRGQDLASQFLWRHVHYALSGNAAGGKRNFRSPHPGPDKYRTRQPLVHFTADTDSRLVVDPCCITTHSFSYAIKPPGFWEPLTGLRDVLRCARAFIERGAVEIKVKTAQTVSGNSNRTIGRISPRSGEPFK